MCMCLGSVMYYNYAGGVIALNRENFHRINGYSNSYWGWGNEDDDFSARWDCVSCTCAWDCVSCTCAKIVRVRKKQILPVCDDHQYYKNITAIGMCKCCTVLWLQMYCVYVCVCMRACVCVHVCMCIGKGWGVIFDDRFVYVNIVYFDVFKFFLS